MEALTKRGQAPFYPPIHVVLGTRRKPSPPFVWDRHTDRAARQADVGRANHGEWKPFDEVEQSREEWNGGEIIPR